MKNLLTAIGAISESNIELLSDRTRDRQVPVYRDRASRVIFIDNFYVGDEEYEEASYREPDLPIEDYLDTQRRYSGLKPLFHGKTIVDFGCGKGSFLKLASAEATTAFGIELDPAAKDLEQFSSVTVFDSIDRVPRETVDTVFAFHVLEHLPKPLEALGEIRDVLKNPSGRLVIEVPHARDFLLDQVDLPAFRSFSLWSQHLVLHTRESLRLLLAEAGFALDTIVGIQRYGLGNHLHWLATGKPGGHKEPSMAPMQDPQINSAYTSALQAMDANDTLLAVARLL